MPKENHFQKLLDELNQKYLLSDEFKRKVADLLERIQVMNLPSEQLEIVADKVRETYQRQNLLDSFRRESVKALEKMRESINSSSITLNQVNEELCKAEAAIRSLLNSKSPPLSQKPEKSIRAKEDRARAMAAFLSIDSKNSRIN